MNFRGQSSSVQTRAPAPVSSTAASSPKRGSKAAREQWRVSSANLTQVLLLDPSAVIVPIEPDQLQFTLIDPARPLDELVAIAVANRPEIGSRQALIEAAEARVRLEKNRPLLPLVLITGFQTPGNMISQFGIFGTGFDRNLNLWSWRDDVSLQLVWQLGGLGFGNLARIKQQRGEASDSIVNLFKTQDTVAAEVNAVQARVQAAAVRVIQADRSLREAIVTYDGNYDGLAQTTRFENVLYQVYRPQEAVKALERLMDSHDQYFTTVADYNRVQFELFHALGYPANEVTKLNQPGELMPVDTDRPFGLPAGGEGPAPVTRRAKRMLATAEKNAASTRQQWRGAHRVIEELGLTLQQEHGELTHSSRPRIMPGVDVGRSQAGKEDL